jgi:hypothetical protein
MQNMANSRLKYKRWRENGRKRRRLGPIRRGIFALPRNSSGSWEMKSRNGRDGSAPVSFTPNPVPARV